MAVDFIIDTVSWYLGFHPKLMTSITQRGDIVEARQICIFFCSKYTKASSVELGQRFNRDHSTILYSREKVEDLRTVEPNYAKKISLIERHLIRQYFEEIEKELIILESQN